MTQTQPCCEKCKLSDVAVANPCICICHSPQEVGWEKKLLELEKGGADIPWWIYTFTREVLASQKAQELERVLAKVKRMELLNVEQTTMSDFGLVQGNSPESNLFRSAYNAAIEDVLSALED